MIGTAWKILTEEKPESISRVVELLLSNRKADQSFLDGELKELQPHMIISGLADGAKLMARHLLEGSKILLVGDYDCDGVTSLAQMVLFLTEAGFHNFETILPLRSEGYGIPDRCIAKHPDMKLLVAMDCGTLDVASVTRARELGADCIVIDHHEVPESGLAPASVLINPKQPGCCSNFKDFCSSGLTLLFLAALRRELHDPLRRPSIGGKYLALAALGTVADIVPLVNANRILTRSGLAAINSGKYTALQKLAEAAGLQGKQISAGHLGFYLGPRINAAGRVADPAAALDLLVSDSHEEIARLAQELNRCNSARQQQEDAVLSVVRERFPQEHGRRTIVMGDLDWPPGIVGIVASRVQQELQYGPSIILSIDEEAGVARGSARSIPGFDIHAALEKCDDLLLRWGGHKMAAGMTLQLEKMEQFKERFEAIAQQFPEGLFRPVGKADMEIELGLIGTELVSRLRSLEPHGMGNPVPNFASRNRRVSVLKVFGRDNSHLRLSLDNQVEGIFWRGVRVLEERHVKDGDRLDIVFQVEWDERAGKPILNIKDIGRLF